MNELFAQLFGQSPSYANALFGEDEAARLRQQAQQQGLLNVGLSLLAGAGPSPQRRGVGQLLAQGVAAGQQAYQGAYDKAMRDRMIQEQLAERQQARAEQQMAREILPQLYRPGAATPTFYGKPTQMPLLDDQGTTLPGAGMTVGQPQMDMAALQQLLTRAPNVAAKVLPTIETLRKLNAPQEFDLAEGQVRYRVDPNTGQAMPVAGAPKPTMPPSKIQEFLAYSNMTPEQQRAFVELQKAGSGGATVYNYPPGALAPDKGTRKDIETALVSSGERLALYNQIEAQFRPEFLQPKFRVGQTWNAIKDKAGAGLTDQERQSLSDFSQFKQNSITNLNKTIKDLTGAAMGVQEAARIITSLPNPGQGLFDGDSPIEFESKLNESMRQLRLVEARNSYILRRGLSFKDVPLNDMPKIINDRAAELARQFNVDLKNITPQQKQAISRQLSVEFGISSD